MDTHPITFPKKVLEAKVEIKSFAERFGLRHLIFACHAAFPMAFTPQLLYATWANFQFDGNGNKLQIEWITVSDFLLSPLCHEVGKELYEIETEIRNQLLDILVNQPNFGKKRLDQLAQFILLFANRKLNSPWERDFALTQRWAALAHLNPEAVAKEIAQEVSKIKRFNTTEWARYAAIAEAFSSSLDQENLSSLILYLRGMKEVSRGNYREAESIFERLPSQGNRLVVAGVLLNVPQFRELDELEDLRVDIPPLRSFEFQTARIVQRPKALRFGSSGWDIHFSKGRALRFTELLDGNARPIEMVKIPGGNFVMGSPDNEGDFRERPQQKISIPSFYFSSHTITQGQWQHIAMGQKVRIDLNPKSSEFEGENLPVEQITWFEAIEFCERLQLMTGRPYRLPSEAEWEYACRAGTTTPFYFGETLSPELANYDSSTNYASGPKGKPKLQTNDVTQVQTTNSFGLYDMHGNVWEWCADHWYDNYNEVAGDGSSRVTINRDSDRVIRGGSWINEPSVCRSAYRNGFPPENTKISVGFRIALSVVS